MTKEVISALGRFSGLLVLSWTAVAPSKDAPNLLDALAAALRARYVVCGSIQRASDRLRVNVQLSERFDEELGDVFALQDRSTRQVVSTLAVRVTEMEQAQSVGKPTESLSAYDLVLRNCELRWRIEREAHFHALEQLERALTIDPDHDERGWTFLNNVRQGWPQWPARALAAAGADASRAIRASVATFTGRPDVALSAMEFALQIDPHPPFDRLVGLGVAYYLEGRYADAIALIDRLAAEAGENPLWLVVLASARPSMVVTSWRVCASLVFDGRPARAATGTTANASIPSLPKARARRSPVIPRLARNRRPPIVAGRNGVNGLRRRLFGALPSRVRR